MVLEPICSLMLEPVFLNLSCNGAKSFANLQITKYGAKGPHQERREFQGVHVGVGFRTLRVEATYGAAQASLASHAHQRRPELRPMVEQTEDIDSRMSDVTANNN